VKCRGVGRERAAVVRQNDNSKCFMASLSRQRLRR
jgi:hypothetical protein